MKEKTTTETNIRKALIAAGIVCPAFVVGKVLLDEAMTQKSLLGKGIGVVGSLTMAALTGYEAYALIPGMCDFASKKFQDHVEINITPKNVVREV